MRSSFESYLKDIGREYAKPLWIASLSAAIVSISAVGLLGLSGWFLAATAIAGAGGPVLIQALNYIWPSALIRLLAILRTVFRYAERLAGHEAGLKALAAIRPDLFYRISQIAPDMAFSMSRGDTSSRLIQDVGSLEAELVTRSASPYAIAGMAMALIMSSFLGLEAALVCFCGFIAHYMVSKQFAKFVNTSNENRDNGDELAETANLKSYLYELIPILPDIKAYDLSQNLLKTANQFEDKIISAKQDRYGADTWLAGATRIILIVTLISEVLVSPGQSTALLAMALLSIVAGFESANANLQRVVQKSLFQSAKERIEEIYTLPPLEPEATITPHQVRLIYGSQTITIDKDTRLQLSGPTGSGKTRLINNLVGFLRPDDPNGFSRGSAFTPEDFSLCAQEAQIISATIKENLTLALDHVAIPNTSDYNIQIDEINRAIADAGLSEKIKSLPMGLDTWIGDGGTALSGGERKRLALARAYLRSAPILILDEPTEGLDAKMEAYVVERLMKRLNETGQALIFTSHRPALAKIGTHCLTL